MDDTFSFVQPGDEGVFAKRTMPKILCCICAVQIDANPANMCVACLRTRVDITEGIPKQLVLHQCRGCLRYLRPPWVACELESRELLAICLKKINGLSKVKLIDAGFIWTEPHSRHIKVKLTIQKDVLSGVRLQQIFTVDFGVANQQCDACARSYTDHHWRAQVQVRQKVDHKKTFYLLEQLILKHGAHEKCSGIEQVPSGVDFNFLERSHALKFIDFLESVVPCRGKAAKQLISEDIHGAVKNYKFTFAVEIVPLCKDDLVVLPSRIAAAIGSINTVALVSRVASVAALVDPRTLQVAELPGDRYWRDPFRALCAASQLIEYTVLDVLPVTVAPLTGTALRRKQGKRAARASSAASVANGGGGGGTMSSASSVVSGYAASSAGKAAAAAATAADGAGAGASAGGTRNKKRRAANDSDEDDGAGGGGGGGGGARSVGGGGRAGSVIGASSVGPSSAAGGFTGAVSLAGGGVHFTGASSVASTVTGGRGGRLLLADAEVVRTRDLGTSDERFIVRTHLGNLLRAGDTVLGYDLTQAVFNEADAESHAIGGKSATKGTGGRGGKVDFPDCVLVRKVFKPRDRREAPVPSASASSGAGAGAGAGDDGMGAEASASTSASRRPRQPRRMWKLKRLEDVGVPVKQGDYNRKGDEERAAAEYEAFLSELESDPALRASINLYKDAAAMDAAKAARAAAYAARKEALRADLAGAAAAGQPATEAGGRAPRVAFRDGDAGAGAGAGSAHADGDDDGGDGDGDDGDEEADENMVGLAELLDDLDIAGAGARAGGAGAGRGRGVGAGAEALDDEGEEGEDDDEDEDEDAEEEGAGRVAKGSPAKRRPAKSGGGGGGGGSGGGGWGGSDSAVEPGFELADGPAAAAGAAGAGAGAGAGTAGRKHSAASARGSAGAAAAASASASAGEEERGGEEDGAAVYEDGGLSLTRAGRKHLRDVPEGEDEDEEEGAAAAAAAGSGK